MGIAPKLLDVIAKLDYKIPTPIQHKAIPVAIEGNDLMGIAQTGTGKTLAFGIPMIQRILQANTGVGLVVLPTRELAYQVNETLQKLGHAFALRTSVLIGGAPMGYQIKTLNHKPHIIVGTPGRIIDHIQQRTLSLHNVSILVLDEADHMFDMGFAPQIAKILAVIPKTRQTMLFSATMPDGIVKIATSHMRSPVRIEMARSGTTAEKVEHELFVVKKEQKNRLLSKILLETKGSVLIFVRLKYNAKRICALIAALGIKAAEIHSNRSLNQRREALDGFKIGRYRVLVATDIAARGIDVKGIELVVNYDLPENPEDYVHRIGRTGRAGLTGKAISFVLPDQGDKIRGIEKLVRIYLPISKLPELPPETRVPYIPSDRPTNRSNYPRRRPFEKTHGRRNY